MSEKKFGSAGRQAGRQAIGGARVGGTVKEMESLRPDGAVGGMLVGGQVGAVDGRSGG